MRATLTLACGATVTLDEREIAAWTMLTPEWRWEVMQLSPTAAHIVLSAEREGSRAMIPENEITTGTVPVGLRYAAWGPWRVVAHADGGYSRNRAGAFGWCLIVPGTEEMPREVEVALCRALNLNPRGA